MSRKGMPPSTFGCSMVNLMWGSIEFRYCSKMSRFPFGMMLNTSSTYLFQYFTGTGNSGPKAIFSKYSIYMLATTGEHGEPIVAPCSCLKNMSWKVKNRAENVCSDPEILAKEIDHLSKVLHYNNYPQWMINQQGKMTKQDPLIHPETGNEIQKCFYISVPYFPGLSESFKKIFKYTPVQVCFKGVNTLKSMLLHSKDKISNNQKKDLVYHWECKADGCNSSYIGETSRALGERVKEHSKSTTSAILKHCKDFHHPLPSIDDFNIIDKEPSQVTREAKEAIHIRRLDPSLNRNIGKMSIPHCFDNLLGAKPKHPRVGELSAAPLPVEEVAPPSQIPGLNLTQFNNIGNFRPNMAIHIPRRSTRACRAKNLFN